MTNTAAGGLTDEDLLKIKQKYREERDKRLRDEGDRQYIETKGDMAEFAEVDPYAPSDGARSPVTRDHEVVIIGGGFGGLFAATRLGKAGIDDTCIIEAGSDFGGTWYWNRYPGCRCDIESYVYIPMLEETGFMPTERYAKGAEIYEQCKRIGQHFGLYEHALFQTRVREIRWDEKTCRWTIETDRDDKITAQFVITSTGPLSKPRLPGIPGIKDFKGHSFHTCRWDFDYTGGTNEGGLDKLGDKKVAIIGTASTGVQAIPHLAEGAEHLYVFQRTPTAVFPRGNKPTDPEWVKSLEPGWQDKRVTNFNEVVTGRNPKVDMVDDCWTEIFKVIPSTTPGLKGANDPEFMKKAEKADAMRMNQIRERVDSLVEDDETAEKLKPWFRVMCKRPTFHDEYLSTYNRDNVTLVDVAECKGVQAITEKGVIANDIEYEVDCIVFATGYEVSSDLHRRVDYQTYGINGESLFDYWKDGRKTLHGHSTHNFPNLFICGVSQSGLSMNFSSMYGAQADHIAYIIGQVKAKGAKAVQPSEKAQDDWVETIYSLSRRNQEFLSECTPSYFNNDGAHKNRNAGFLSDAYAPGILAFNELMAEWRDQGDCEGLEFIS
jgi:cation diffusion facilitator CzcD-associated flavoprotein CzcO